ncbi:AAEL004966-PA [Aedes aegypti]|uniref:Odorant receptor n=2 Tax=Aedes aegypti TaxID=7159 RepID=A0A1S7UEC0_AEDAE|nr:AAEL004966-PA [Aedes aegypti]DAA80368.1 TPA_exp: odorant receptor 20 [Aedes aegypti]
MDLLNKLQKYHIFRHDYKGADVAYINTIDRIEYFSGFMGINLFNRVFKFCNFTFLWGVSTLFIYIYLVLTSTYYYRNDIEKALSCVTTFGFSTQGASKIYSFILRRKKVIVIHEMNLAFFKLDIMQNETVKKAFQPSVQLNHILLTLTIYGYIGLVAIIALTPELYGLIISKCILPFGFEIIHSDAGFAYAINSWFQVNCTYYVAFLTTVTDGTFILYLLNATGQIDAIVELLHELDDMMMKEHEEQKIDEQLQKIITIHKHHQLYMRKVEHLFNLYFLISIASLCFNMSISLAAFVLIDWYLGVVVFCFASSQIFYMCFLGSYYETKSEFLITEIGSFDWYKLSVKNQKMVNFILATSQSPILVTAILENLNVAAYLKIHKTVYSGIMLLLRVKD